MNKKLKCAVVGVGYLGEHHARIYSELENTELVAVMDANEARAKEIADKFSCKVASSLEEVASLADVVSVVVPTDRHSEVALELLDSNCHLLVEKPFCTTLSEAEALIAKAKEKNLIIQVGHIEHFNPVMDIMEAQFKSPKYIVTDRIAPFNIRGSEVGVVLDLMIHDIGIVLALANSEVVSVDAVGSRVLSPREDIANARIKFANSCVANLNVSRVSQKRIRQIKVFQDSAYVSLDFMTQSGHLVKMNEAGELISQELVIEKDEALKRELSSFADCVINNKKPKVDALLATKALEVALEITRQISL
ncbi:MAG: Gfo/Idh/MocA family oxidoreductase [Opitutales bacterium]